MKLVRNDVFETNSSSVHSLVVHRKYPLEYEYPDLHVYDDGYIHIPMDKFGWGYDGYIDSKVKLTYAMGMVYQTESRDKYDEDYRQQLGNFYDTVGYKAINDMIKEYYNCDGILVDKLEHNVYPYGYIDHQSTEDYSSLKDFLDDYGVTLEQFVFDPNVTLIIDNDNH